MAERHGILVKFDRLKRLTVGKAYSPEIAALLTQLYLDCLSFLSSKSISRLDLISKVPGKNYFAFKKPDKISRAVRKTLYEPDIKIWNALMRECAKKNVAAIPRSDLEKTLYSMAISFCASIDLLKKGDQQTPGTFFGKFVAFFFASQLGVEPLNYVNLMNYDEPDVTTKLQTDLIFDLGKKKQKFHVPVKTSTRERAIMLWAHQKLIDGAYGVERFMGTPVLLAETKTNTETKEVVEICLADQWRVYQLYISRLKRIYYLDLPEAYRELNSEFPPIYVKPFAEFFSEWRSLMPQ